MIFSPEIQPDATAVAESEEFSFDLDIIIERIIEESLALYDLLPEGDWSNETTVPIVMEFDIISHLSYLPPLYPPKVKRLLAKNTILPDYLWLDTPTMPPEMIS